MLQFALDFLEKCGVYGLFAATALEASALPFPGALFILIYGYIMDVGPWKLVLLAAANSVVYTIFTLIPYAIGNRLEKFSSKRMNKKKLKKAQAWFKKYGEWSIALSRPLSIGNYISYLSGFSRVKPWRFILLTYLGIFPWSTLLLFIGNKGSIETIQQFLEFCQRAGFFIIVAIVILGIVWFYFRRNQQKQRSEKS